MLLLPVSVAMLLDEETYYIVANLHQEEQDQHRSYKAVPSADCINP